MYLILGLTLSLVAGDTFTGTATIDGIGAIALPPGKWTLEHAVSPETKTNEPNVYVFRKEGDRLERLTIQKFGPHIAHPIASYFDLRQYAWHQTE